MADLTTGEHEWPTYTLMLLNAGPDRLAVLMEIRRLRPDLGLKGAKAIIDSAPKMVTDNVHQLDRDKVERSFALIGASIEFIYNEYSSKDQMPKAVDHVHGRG